MSIGENAEEIAELTKDNEGLTVDVQKEKALKVIEAIQMQLRNYSETVTELTKERDEAMVHVEEMAKQIKSLREESEALSEIFDALIETKEIMAEREMNE